MRYFSIPEIMKLIMAECELEGGIRPWCDNRGLHPSIVDKFLSGQRGPAPQLLRALDLEKVTVYRRAGSTSPRRLFDLEKANVYRISSTSPPPRRRRPAPRT